MCGGGGFTDDVLGFDDSGGIVGSASSVSEGITNQITDDLLGFDPGGGGIYDVTRDVLGDDLADDVLGFDPGGGGIVPVTNTVADMAVKYAIGQAVGSAFDTGGSGSVQVFDDGSTLYMDASGNPIGYVDTAGQAGAAVGVESFQVFDDGSAIASINGQPYSVATDAPLVVGGTTAGTIGGGPELPDVGYTVDPQDVVKAVDKAGSLLKESEPTPSGIQTPQLAGRPGSGVDYSGLLGLLSAGRARTPNIYSLLG